MTVNVRDRTREFNATVESLFGRNVARIGQQFDDPLLGGGPRSPRLGQHALHAEFMAKATEINNGIQRVLGMLEKLKKLARNKTLLDDRPVEVQDLTQAIKADLARLNGQISDLQNAQKMQRVAGYVIGTNKSAEEHSSQVVVSLQSRLAEASSTFSSLLEERSQSIRAQKSRRDQFSATNIMPMPTAIPRQRNVRDSPGPPEGEGHVAIEMPTQSLQQLALMTAAPDTAYLESRSAALQGIEATINELGTIYRQLATMIAEQGEQVQRIDMNIEHMHLNIERGQSELVKYLRSVSSNRWLMIKIFAVLIVFIIFFAVFLI